MERLVEWSRFYLNQDLVDQFIAHLGVYPVGTLVRLSSGIVGVVTQQGERGFSHPVIRAIYDMAKNKWLSRIEINLSKKADRGETDEIVSCESPNRYAVDPAALLGSETIFSHRGADDFSLGTPYKRNSGSVLGPFPPQIPYPSDCDPC